MMSNKTNRAADLSIAFITACGNGSGSGSLKSPSAADNLKADEQRILFDYADIFCRGNDGLENTTSWDGHNFQHIYSDNVKELDGTYAEEGDHIGERGTVRLAKAMG